MAYRQPLLPGAAPHGTRRNCMRDELARYPELIHLVDEAAPSRAQALRDLTVAVQQIPAPTGAEGERAAFVERRLRGPHSAAGALCDVGRDAEANVFARLPGRSQGPALLVSAHTDTVFPAGTDLTLQRDESRHRLCAPGIGDNSAGVAALLLLADLLPAGLLPVDVWFVANTCEEGLGDLRGMRAAVDRLQPQIGAAIVVEGMGLGRIVHQGLGSRRFKIGVRAPGGHSWSAFGSPSAVHTLVQVAERLTRLEAPPQPRTTFNIGRFQGGTSVNTIAESAWLELDLRSESGPMLAHMVEQTQGVVRRYQTAHWRQRGVEVTLDSIGDRPTGAIPAGHPLVLAAERALASVGVPAEAGERMSSTDANIPLSRGIPSVCVGVTRGGNAHRLDEWISTVELGAGLQHLLLLTGWAAAWLGREL
jgi:acetylornithine deacetylase/succinyl-diaminopimelate desuccinylase-like protein